MTVELFTFKTPLVVETKFDELTLSDFIFAMLAIKPEIVLPDHRRDFVIEKIGTISVVSSSNEDGSESFPVIKFDGQEIITLENLEKEISDCQIIAVPIYLDEDEKREGTRIFGVVYYK